MRIVESTDPIEHYTDQLYEVVKEFAKIDIDKLHGMSEETFILSGLVALTSDLINEYYTKNIDKEYMIDNIYEALKDWSINNPTLEIVK